MEAHETRAMLTARKPVQQELLETESSRRGILRGFGLKVGKTTPVEFEGRIRELATEHPSLEVITSALLSVRAVLRRQLNDFEKRLRAIARTDRVRWRTNRKTHRPLPSTLVGNRLSAPPA
jgi:transposase